MRATRTSTAQWARDRKPHSVLGGTVTKLRPMARWCLVVANEAMAAHA
jgi:hypothetical protein